MGMIKTKKEIALLKKSAQITDSCLKVIEYSLKEKITESGLRRRIYRNIKKHGAELAFRTLVACGKRSSMIHAKPHATDKIIRGIGLVDFGASYKGYKTDVTVPFVKGKATKMERKIINTALGAYSLSISALKIGQPCWELYKKVNGFTKNRGFQIPHGLGHGLGLKVHEYPSIVMPRKKKLSKKGKRRWEKIKKMTFQKNMVFTIEPGVYVKGVGGCRLENDVLMTAKGPKVLTHSKLIEV